ncbi:hypothetical protein V5799_012628, partial [Amblyomma americanum]
RLTQKPLSGASSVPTAAPTSGGSVHSKQPKQRKNKPHAGGEEKLVSFPSRPRLCADRSGHVTRGASICFDIPQNGLIAQIDLGRSATVAALVLLTKVMPTKGAHLWDAKEEKHECDDVKCEQGLISRSPGNCSGASQQLLCSICKKTFSRKYHLARHLQNAVCSGEQRLSLPCSTCGKVFSSKTKLDHHVKTHSVASDSNQKSSLKRFECNHCGRLFWSLSQLEIHKRMHTDRLRENCKVLFTQVLEDDVAGKLLDSDETVDAVLEKVLQLARLG